jgi:diguanylate cyclase (GGDEF)-like protein
MSKRVKKTALQERPEVGAGPAARSSKRAPGPRAAESSIASLSQLMAELDRLKAELTVSQERVSELENKAHEDALLPVMNRRGFDQELERTLAYIKRHGTDVSLIYIDLDDFKSINDVHGHGAGDAALLHLTDILIANVRRSDIVARLGGDEFAILLQRADENAALMKADQLARGLASSGLIYEGKEIPMSLTAGTTQLRSGDTSVAALARADKLMYADKTRRKRTRSTRSA